MVLQGLGVALGAGLLLFFLATAYNDTVRPGELVFAEESVDVGQVLIGQPVIHRFSMRNAGGKPVTITRKSASAVEGC